MSPCVIDASMAGAWCLPDEAANATDWLDEVVRGGAVVPAIFRYEIGNVLLTAVRRGRISEAVAAVARKQLAGLPITVDPVRSFDDLAVIHLLAQEHRLSIYDASYLELAMRHGARLGSYDEPLLRAARAVGVRTEL